MNKCLHDEVYASNRKGFVKCSMCNIEIPTVDTETEQSIYSCNNHMNCKFKLLGTTNYGCSYGKYCDFKVPRDSRNEE